MNTINENLEAFAKKLRQLADRGYSAPHDVIGGEASNRIDDLAQLVRALSAEVQPLAACIDHSCGTDIAPALKDAFDDAVAELVRASEEAICPDNITATLGCRSYHQWNDRS